MTLRANELRIGNWVHQSVASEFCQIYAHGIAAFALHESTRNPDEPAMYLPIPLTEEWLIRFGFELLLNSKLWYVFDGFALKKEDGYFGCYMGITVKVTFAHQLQNLYFALTGEELPLANHPI